MLPEKWSTDNVSFLAKSLEAGFADEQVEVHGGADHLCAPPGRDRNTGSQGLPKDGDCRAVVSPLEEEVIAEATSILEQDAALYVAEKENETPNTK